MKTLEQKLIEIKKQNRIGIVTHVVVGYPDLETTYRLVKTMVEAGVDAIELQIPFSDPMADGSSIMHASEVALSSGTTPADCMVFVKRVSQEFDIPFIFMSYYNIVNSFGPLKFVESTAEVGAAGLIIPDALPDTPEGKSLYESAANSHLVPITVLAPNNSSERLKELQDDMKGLVYLPLHQGVTGARQAMRQNLEKEVKLIKTYTDAAIMAGFGISKPEHVTYVKKSGVDMVVVGSALLNTFNESGHSGVKGYLQKMVKELPF